MARTNQGVFTKLKEDYEKVKKDYLAEKERYEKPAESVDFFSELALTSNDLFKELKSLEYQLAGMLASTKFENDDTRHEYEVMKEAIHNMADDLQTVFKERIRLLSESNGGLWGIECRTIETMAINL
ncbi:hypothetical protein SAMN02910358_02612 [Lachnospiraceae bacterium XBB1006]|nr:hypothetical protein SAMN02910358_02612 [Lachnospiraceae bacterium XBB1006]